MKKSELLANKLAQLELLKEERDRLATEFTQVETETIALAKKLGFQQGQIGDTKVTYTEGENLTLDAEKLYRILRRRTHYLVSRPDLFTKETIRTFDEKKLQPYLEDGTITVDDVARCTTITPRKGYFRFTKQKGESLGRQVRKAKIQTK